MPSPSPVSPIFSSPLAFLHKKVNPADLTAGKILTPGQIAQAKAHTTNDRLNPIFRVGSRGIYVFTDEETVKQCYARYM